MTDWQCSTRPRASLRRMETSGSKVVRKEEQGTARRNDMDKDYGREVVRTFGVRLRRVFEQDTHALPVPMAETLERLKQAEERIRDGSAPFIARITRPMR